MEDGGMGTAMVWTLSLVIGVIASLVASGMFLLLMSRWRPKIEIAPAIAKSRSGDKFIYNIKIINRTKRPVVGVKVRMMLATIRYVSQGPIFNLRPIELKTSEVMEIPGFDASDPEAPYALRFEIREDLDALWGESEHSHLRFQIYATHSLTGFGKAKQEKYFQKRTAIQEGDYAAKDSFEIS